MALVGYQQQYHSPEYSLAGYQQQDHNPEYSLCKDGNGRLTTLKTLSDQV